MFVLLAMVLTLSSCDEIIGNILGGETEKVEVTFDSCGGSEVEGQLVELGGYVVEPDAPTRQGYKFAGWCTDESFSYKWRFDVDTVDDSMTLCADWTKVTPPAHKCESICSECGKCLDRTCTEEACEKNAQVT